MSSIRRSNSNPVFSSAIRRHVRGTNINNSVLTSMIRPTAGTSVRHNASTYNDGPTARENSSYQSQHGGESNSHQGMATDPYMQYQVSFSLDPASKVSVPQLTEEEKRAAPRRQITEMKKKYGELGPGDKVTKSMTAVRREMITAEEDVDGLPWEVRWKQNLVPTPEEVISEVRDRFELQYPDPIEREKQWYLHWKDRMFSMSQDRLIWPQGYTDYLDMYDEFGRRRVLPTDEKWSDSSWKALADSNYRGRLFLMDTLERRHFHELHSGKERLMKAEEAVIEESMEMFHGVEAGAIDLSPDQEWEQIVGSANPAEIQEGKMKLAMYDSQTRHLLGKELPPDMIDPVTSLPKSNLKPYPTGITVEEAALIATITHDKAELPLIRAAETSKSLNPGMDVVRVQLEKGKAHGNRPMHTAVAGAVIDKIRIAKGELNADHSLPAIGEEKSGTSLHRLASSEAAGISDFIDAVENEASKSAVEMKEERGANRPENEDEDRYRGYIPIDNDHPALKVPVPTTHSFETVPSDTNLKEMPKWYEKSAVFTEPMIKTYGLTNDPLETTPIHPSSFVNGAALDKNKKKAKTIVTRSSEDNDKKRSVGYSAFDDAPTEGVQKEVDEEEEMPPSLFHTQPTTFTRITQDDIGKQGVSSFDIGKFTSETIIPELRDEYKPLPTFSKVATSSSGSELITTNNDNTPITFRQKRLAMERHKRRTLEQELLLPDMPWEASAIEDPMRAVAEADTVPFVRAVVEEAYQIYRDFFFRVLFEANNLSKMKDDIAIIDFVRGEILNMKNQQFGRNITLPKDLHEDQLKTLQCLFEANFLRYLSDRLEVSGSRFQNPECDALKRQSDDVARVSIAKAKLLGPSMTNFISELATVETERLKTERKAKVLVHAVDKAFNPVTKPFMDWYNGTFVNYAVDRPADEQQIRQHAEVCLQALQRARIRANELVPTTDIPATSSTMATQPKQHQAVVDAFSNWSRGIIYFTTGTHLLRLMKQYASSSFRNKAEAEFLEANDHFCGAFMCGKSLCQLPTPSSTPYYVYDHTNFPTMEAAEMPIFAEARGDLETAEKGWSVGSDFVWYPIVDETEVVAYYERRGSFDNVFAISERTLDNLNKKTHPSVHPFPERGIKFLEGAPLTRETAEHLWMRYMGQVYWEHSQIYARLMQFRTARDMEKKGLNFLFAAVQQAADSLPATWRAPLLTKAIYLIRSSQGSNPVRGEGQEEKHIKDVEDTVEKLYELELENRRIRDEEIERIRNSMKGGNAVAVTEEPNVKYKKSMEHWIDRYTNLPVRIALLMHNTEAYSAYLSDLAMKSCPPISDAVWDKAIKCKVVGEDPALTIPEIARFERAYEDMVEEKIRKKILRWRSLERTGSSEYHMLTFIYFNIKTKTSKNPEEAKVLYELYRPTLDFFYTNICLENAIYGEKYIHRAIRILFNILSTSESIEHKKLLLKELAHLHEHIPDTINKDEIVRSINSVEAYIRAASDPTTGASGKPLPPLYCYASRIMMEEMEEHNRMVTNPDLKVSTKAASESFLSMKDRMEKVRKIQQSQIR